MTTTRALGWALVVAAALPVTAAAEEDFKTLVGRLQKEKPTFAKRQADLLAERYDLADRPAPGVTMSRGKPVQGGVRVKLPKGKTWDDLAKATPAELWEIEDQAERATPQVDLSMKPKA